MNNPEVSQICHEIQLRIAQLETLSDADLKTEMDDLKMCLLRNPAACDLLLPEDIGILVRMKKHQIYGAKTAAEKPSSRRAKSASVNLTALLDLEDE